MGVPVLQSYHKGCGPLHAVQLPRSAHQQRPGRRQVTVLHRSVQCCGAVANLGVLHGVQRPSLEGSIIGKLDYTAEYPHLALCRYEGPAWRPARHHIVRVGPQLQQAGHQLGEPALGGQVERGGVAGQQSVRVRPTLGYLFTTLEPSADQSSDVTRTATVSVWLLSAAVWSAEPPLLFSASTAAPRPHSSRTTPTRPTCSQR